MYTKKIAIIGAGGGSRDVLEIFDARNRLEFTYDVLGFIVDPQFSQQGEVFNDKPVLGGFDWLSARKNEVQVICGLGASEQRMRLVHRAKMIGVEFCSVIHPTAVLGSRIRIGKGTSIAAGCILTNNVTIGNHVQVNVGCTISHDVLLNDFVTLAPGVNIAGNVLLKDGCFVGIGASIIEKRRIGAWSILGAGCTVINDVPSNSTVVGVPGKVIKSRPVGWHLDEG